MRKLRTWFTRGRRTAGLTTRQWLSLLAIPVILLGLFAYAFHDPVKELPRVQAAVVNNDKPVTVNGQVTPLGRELAASLVNANEPNYDWVLTNSDDAADGLSSGRYRVVVTIPEQFSAHATSIGGPEPADAKKATIDIRSADNVPLADAAVGRLLADQARRSLGTTITENYLENVYESLGTMRTKLGEAADGAKKLADGADSLKQGTGQLKSGSATLASSLDQLSDGATKLSTGADQAASGAAQLSSGATSLHQGTSQLSSGLGTLRSQTASLPSQTQQLADGSAQVANGTQQLADAANPALSSAVAAIDASPSAVSDANTLKALIGRCDGSPDFCARLSALSGPVSTNAAKLDGLKSDVRGKIVSAQSNVNALNSGAHQVASGNAALAKASVPLTRGISDAASGAAQVDQGAAQLDTGAASLKNGTASLASGAKQLSSGAGQAATGAHQLADGAAKVDQGAGQLVTGSHQLADGLKSSLTQVPDYTAAERDHLKQIVAVPLASEVIGTDGYTNSAMALFAVIALWAGALGAFSMLRAMPRDITTSDRATWRLALVGSLPGAALGAAQALLVTVILALATNATLPRFALMLVAALVATAAFMVLNRVLVAVAAAPGRVLSMLVVALALATGVTSAQPGILQSVANLLPTTAALGMFRNALGGAAGPTWISLLPLLLWLALAYVATLILTERARIVPVRALRPHGLDTESVPATQTQEDSA